MIRETTRRRRSALTGHRLGRPLSACALAISRRRARSSPPRPARSASEPGRRPVLRLNQCPCRASATRPLIELSTALNSLR